MLRLLSIILILTPGGPDEEVIPDENGAVRQDVNPVDD